MKKIVTYTTPLHTHYKGFLLIELLVAIMIISSLSLILAQFQGNARNIHVACDERVDAIHKATSFLEQGIGSGRAFAKIGRKDKSSLSDRDDARDDRDDRDNYTLVWRTYSPNPVNGLPIADVYQFVDVTVSWDDYAGKKRSLQLTTGMVIP